MCLSGVIHLHCEHVIHRDLATRNCLVKLSPTSIALDLKIPSLSTFIYSLVPWPLLSWPTVFFQQLNRLMLTIMWWSPTLGWAESKPVPTSWPIIAMVCTICMHPPLFFTISLRLAMANASVFFCLLACSTLYKALYRGWRQVRSWSLFSPHHTLLQLLNYPFDHPSLVVRLS